MLRWLIQRGIVAIPKSVHKDRIAENFAFWDFALSEGDMARIADLDMDCSLFFSHRDPDWVRSIATKVLDSQGIRRYTRVTTLCLLSD